MTRILIAEDERDIRELITITLSFAGYEVIPTKNGEEALRIALNPEQTPDLILMDIRMPVMTGYEACEILKANDMTRDIPVVFLSAKGQESEVKLGLEVGAEDYILKPFSLDELTTHIVEILSRKKKAC